jgi:hypothetical protein
MGAGAPRAPRAGLLWNQTSDGLRFGRSARRVRRRSILAGVVWIRAAEAPIELRADDVLDVLGDESDDEVDQTFLSAPVAAARLPLVDDVSDPLGDEMHDRVDDPFLVEVIAAVVAVAIAVATAVVPPIAVALPTPIVLPRAALVVA